MHAALTEYTEAERVGVEGVYAYMGVVTVGGLLTWPCTINVLREPRFMSDACFAKGYGGCCLLRQEEPPNPRSVTQSKNNMPRVPPPPPHPPDPTSYPLPSSLHPHPTPHYHHHQLAADERLTGPHQTQRIKGCHRSISLVDGPTSPSNTLASIGAALPQTASATRPPCPGARLFDKRTSTLCATDAKD